MITLATGAHLTTADRRNINAVMNHPSFVFGHAYKVNGRKTYTISDLGDDVCGVVIAEPGRDDWGRKVVRNWRSSFTRKAPA